MLNKRKNYLRKNMAVLVCAAFVLMFFSGIAHSSTEPSSSKVPSIKKPFSFVSSFFSLFNFHFLGDKPPANVDKNKDDKDKDSYDDHGNSTSKKKPNGKD